MDEKEVVVPIDFTPTPRQRALQLESRKFAKTVLSEARRTTNALPTPEERFAASRPFYEELIAAGFLRKSIPVPFGGEATSRLDMAIMAEEFYAVDPSVSLTMLGSVLGLLPVFLGGSKEQQERLIKPFLRKKGAPLAAFAFSEPGGIANAASPPPGEGVRTRATLQGDEWVLTGSKKWVSSATGWDGKGADLICVVCRTDPEVSTENSVSVIALEKPRTGIVLEKALDSIGHRSHLLPVFHMRDAKAPKANLIGTRGGGLQLTENSFIGTAAIAAVFAVGLMRAAFDYALEFAKTERRGGVHPIIEHQAVGYALVDAKTSIEATRYLAWRACHALDLQSPGGVELALQAKVHGSETAVRVITDLMRIVGCDSYDATLPLAGLLQDALALPVFDGGNMGVRRKQLHALLMSPTYDTLAASGAS
jgi:alkylation response protein AidB-like acyl-CoA dehydrogenase